MLKYMWNNHRSLCLLILAYIVPAQITFFLTWDSELAVCVGGLTILAASPIIWKYS